MPLRETDARRLLRRLLAEGILVVSPHARIEMNKDNLTNVDVVNILRAGLVQPAEWENGSWRYRVLTQRMAAVAAFDPDVDAVPADEDDVSEMELIVVTAWRQKS
jgi:hypothetical protein